MNLKNSFARKQLNSINSLNSSTTILLKSKCSKFISICKSMEKNILVIEKNKIIKKELKRQLRGITKRLRY